MKSCALLSAAALITSTASATFTGLTVEMTYHAATGRNVYSMYANFSVSNDRILNVFDTMNISGSMNALHNDNAFGCIDTDGDGYCDFPNATGSWDPAYNGAGVSSDSFVWLGAPGPVELDSGFGGPFNNRSSLANSSGWYDGTPGSQNLAGPTLRVKVLQVARLAAGETQYVGQFNVGYAAFGATTPLFSGNVQYTLGAQSDADGDGVPNTSDNCPMSPNPTQSNNDGDAQGDVCDPDDDNDGVPDTSDNCPLTANASQADCDSDGTGDTCENALDGNSDGIPDTCQGAILYVATSSNLGAPSGLAARLFTFTNLTYAESAVQLTIDVRGDLGAANEWIDVSLNGGANRRFFEASGQDCPSTPNQAAITLTREEFGALIAGASASLTVSLTCPAAVDPAQCVGAGLTEFTLSYIGINPLTGDCDSDHRLDIYAIDDGTVPDCNSNTRPDSCDLASGLAFDCDGNGVLDICDVAGGGGPADCNGNGKLDSCDIASGLSGDIDGNTVPDECQTVTVPGSYSTIQAAITSAPQSVMRIVTLSAGTHAGPINFMGKPIILRGVSAATSVISGASAGSSVVRFAGEPAIAALERVTVRGGTTGTQHPLNPSAYVGGGIFLNQSGATVRDCTIENNVAGFGGGIYSYRPVAARIERCIVRNNFATEDGGGIQVAGGTNAVVDCTIELNYAGHRGAGVHLVEGVHQLTDSTIRTNECNDSVGGLSWVPGSVATAHLALDGCEITSNTALMSQGGVGVAVGASGSRTSLASTTVCGNLPRPNFSGLWTELGGSTVCDCTGDLLVDGAVNGVDLAIVLTDWGNCADGCLGDVDHDGSVDGSDLAALLTSWGVCPPG